MTMKWVVKRLAQKNTRKQRSIELMKRLEINLDCELCFHGITKNCTNNLPNGCEHFWNRTIEGLKRNKFVLEVNRKKWLKRIKHLNPKLKIA